MKNDDLENTLPINVITEDEEEIYSREQKNRQKELEEEEIVSREERFKNIEEEDNNDEYLDNEEAEEALAEKNIAEAEALLEKENENNQNQPKEEKLSLIQKFKKLPKKNKIIIISIGIIILIILIVVIIFFITKKDKNPSELIPSNKEPEKAPVIVDNYYYQNGILHILDKNEEEIGTYECINKDEKLCYVGYNNYRDDFDTDQLLDETNKEKTSRLPIYNEEFVFIADKANETDTNIILYSLKTNSVEGKYNSVKAFDNNYIIVEDTKNNFGLIEINEDVKELIEPKYEYLGMLDQAENLVAKNNKGYFIINKKAQELSKTLPANNKIKYYSNELIVTTIDNDYNVYNYNGDLLASGYNYATVKDQYMALVNDNKLYIKDIDKLKFNESGLSLKNNNYVRKYIYDEHGHLTKTKVSFTIEVRDSDLEIAIYDSDSDNPNYTRLDKSIITLNKQYKYLNYFNDKLYFYKDENKEELIGSYTCSNKNSTTGDNHSLDNCLPAKDTIFEDNETTTKEEKERKTTIPIINNRFVFITDGSKNINLYDLVDNKTLGSYEAVNTYLKDNNYEFSNYSGVVEFIALNKKGKYGMVTIDSNKAATKYTFIYNHLEKMGSYLLGQDENYKWLLIYGEDSTSATFDGKIAEVSTDKKHFKILSSNKYMVYSNSGEKVSSETYKSAKLYQNYYGAINSSNELIVYDYTGKELTEGIKVNNNTCSIGDLYKIENNNGKYRVLICNNNIYEASTPNLKEEKPAQEPSNNDKEDDSNATKPTDQENQSNEEQSKKEE